MRTRFRWLVSIISVSLAAVALAAAGPGYHVVTTYKLGGEGGWDYLITDPDARRTYISRGTHVVVIDADTGKSVGDIADTPGVHGIALAPELGRGFTSNGREGTVSIFDIKTLATSSKVKVGDNPDAILYDPATKRVFTFNGRSQDSTAIDAATGKVLGTIKLGGKPEFAASDAKGGIWVNIEDKSELVAIDPSKLEVKAKWPLAPCTEPSGLAIDRKNRRLFAGCDNKMMAVVDADSGKVLATPAIGDGVDATAFDPESGLAFASCGGDGVLTVVKEDSPDKFSVAENVPTEKGARTMALDTKTHNVFVVTAQFGPRPAPTADNPHPRPAIVSDSFVVLVVGK
jgi:DNA-binding beta-propeller fold protein YncE